MIWLFCNLSLYLTKGQQVLSIVYRQKLQVNSTLSSFVTVRQPADHLRHPPAAKRVGHLTNVEGRTWACILLSVQLGVASSCETHQVPETFKHKEIQIITQLIAAYERFCREFSNIIVFEGLYDWKKAAFSSQTYLYKVTIEKKRWNTRSWVIDHELLDHRFIQLNQFLSAVEPNAFANSRELLYCLVWFDHRKKGF
jgi:hypothetical protein